MKSLEDVSTQRTVSTAIFILSCYKKKKEKRFGFLIYQKINLVQKARRFMFGKLLLSCNSTYKKSYILESLFISLNCKENTFVN